MSVSGGSPKSVPRETLPGVRVFPDPGEVARAAARLFVDDAWQAIMRDGLFSVALSGGNTPRTLFVLLASSEFRGQVDWAKVHLFWGDERTVPPDSPESNYGMARRELLLRVPVPPANVHRMEAERADLGRAAHDYEEVLRRILPLDERGFPRFHLIFLGMGPDGHTASLFPGAKITRQTSRWVSTPMVAKLGTKRMTLTLPVLEAAHRVVFLIAGAEKAETLRGVLEGKADPPFPAQMVVPVHGERLFLVDQAAASLLEPAAQKKSAGPAAKPSDIRTPREGGSS